MQYLERQIIAWLAILLGSYFLARATVNKRQKGAMKELLGVQIDKVKFFRNYFIQRLESMVGFSFILVGVGIHLYVLIRQAQQNTAQNDPQGALWDALTYLGFAVLAMFAITIVMNWICSWFSRRIFLDILGYLMVRYDFRLEEDPELMKQIGDMVNVKRLPDDTVQSYTQRIEEALKLSDIDRKLRARGKFPARHTDLD